MADSIELFSDDGKSAIIPSTERTIVKDAQGNEHDVNSETNGRSLISHGVEDALRSEYVKSILIPETLDITLPNYILDFRKAKTLRKHQVEALASIIVDDGDTAIYVYLNNGMTKLGMGISDKLDNILLPGMQSIFGDLCTVYKDVQRGKPIKPMEKYNPTMIRLKL